MGFHLHLKMNRFSILKSVQLLLALVISSIVQAQIKLDLTSLSDFNNPTANWHIGSTVHADINTSHQLSYTPGTGILLNLPEPAAHKDLFTNFKHGDMDIEFDCMMAKESNSGIYLQGRYEIQLLDSWGVINPRSTDMGGIYERNDEKRPAGARSFEGRAPRQNVSKAPGLWQHYKISFQAPKFLNGIKTENAKFLKVELNGVLIHENIELTGPTAGSVDDNEVAEDALRIQGDHGQVAFRNIVISQFPQNKPSLSEITSVTYLGKFEKQTDVSSLKPLLQKNNPYITVNIDGVPKNNFLTLYKGVITILETGEYTFNVNLRGGAFSMNIGNKVVYPFGENNIKATATLTKGSFPFELQFSKYKAAENPILNVRISSANCREFVISDPKMMIQNSKDPVLIEAKENIVLRTFMDVPDSKRVVHAVNVGTPMKVNYTYDMDNGNIFQVWRGDFLDASPMWVDRGDGSSRPLGAIQYTGAPSLSINKLENITTPWTSDTTATGFTPKGYIIDDMDRPSFKYNIYGNSVTDITKVLENRQGIQRTIVLKNTGEKLYVRIATAADIEEISSGFYLLDDHSYYIKLDDTGNASAIIREQNGKKELLIPIQNKITYSILF